MTDKKTERKFLRLFGQSEQKNFKIIDTIGVPHPYCIAPVHLEYNDSMYLGSEQIIKMEKEHPKKVMCDICKHNKSDKILSYEEHKQALLVKCLKDFHKDKELNKELKDWLLSIKNKCEKKKYAGFAFLEPDKNE